VDDVLPFNDFSKDGVVSRKPVSCCNGDEKLAAVCVRTGVSHRQLSGLIELIRGAFGLVGELVAGTAHSGTAGIAALDHEIRDHAMEDRSVVERPGAFLAAHVIAPIAFAFG